MKRTRVALPAGLIVVVLIVTAGFLLLAPGGPDPAQFEYLKEPPVRVMADHGNASLESMGRANLS